MPYPPTVSVTVPLENYNVCISLLKSPLDFKKLLTEYQDVPKSCTWDLYGMDKPIAYPCLYTYYADEANYIASALPFAAEVLIKDYADTAYELSAWCATQLNSMCKETEI